MTRIETAGQHTVIGMPTVFIGHGSPMNAIEPTRWNAAWRQLTTRLPRPKAVLAISAHYYVPGTRVTTSPTPRTIHDFAGFPDELFQVRYPAPGDPALAEQVADLLRPATVDDDPEWGLDHGTWSVLRHLFPKADVPVVQLSVDASLGPTEHFELARRLRPLRDEGVLLLGSGNIVHNLRLIRWEARSDDAYEWATRFDAATAAIIDGGAGKIPALDDYLAGPDALLAVPTPDHYLPLLYVAALRDHADTVSYPVQGMDLASISMRSVLLEERSAQTA